MRDGTQLAADVYRPAEGQWPVLLYRTPYSRDLLMGTLPAVHPVHAAASGFAVVQQDVRGRFDSGGDFYPFVHEADDGVDTIAWLAAQPWSTGTVGMYGSSYMGATQLQAMTAAPPALVAACPTQASSDYYEGRSYWGGALELGGLTYIAAYGLGIGTLQSDPSRFAERFREVRELLGDLEAVLSDRPIEDRLRASILADVAPFFFDWIAHPEHDEYWERIDNETRYDRVQAAGLHITGWFDQFHVGTLRNFAGIRARGRGETRDRQTLLVGPWAHYPPRTAQIGTARMGDVVFGLSAILDLENLQLAWLRRWLHDDPGAWEWPAPVRLFVMGANRWRFEESWPLARAEDRDLYLADPPSGATPGRLEWTRPGGAIAEFDFDPRHPVPTRGGAHLLPEFLYPQGPVRQDDLDERPDVLSFESDVLASDIEVTGWVRAELWVQSSAPFTDFTARLIDVWPDGRSFNVCDGIARVRLSSMSLVDDWNRVDVSLGATSMVFQRGHRVKVHISSSNFPRFDVNPNTGGSVLREAVTVVAHQRLKLGGATASRVVLPIVAGSV
jgi:putative CocE/NonD family hydrolase